MLVADCPCGTRLVLAEDLARRIKECPTCGKPIQVVGPNLPEPAPDDGHSLWVKTCGCGKVLVVDEEQSSRMLRCPACDRLIEKFHTFGQEFWRRPKDATAAAAPAPAPAPCEARPLAFRYDRGGLLAILAGLLMLGTLALRWRVTEDGGCVGDLGGITSWALLSGFLESMKGSGPWLWNAPTFFVGGWAAGLLAIFAGTLLRRMARFILIAVVGAASLVLLVTTSALAPYGIRQHPQEVYVIGFLLLLAPVAIAAGVRLRVGPRRALTILAGIGGGLLAMAGLATFVIAIVVLWHVCWVNQPWGWDPLLLFLNDVLGWVMGFPGSTFILGTAAGVGCVLQGLVAKWDGIGPSLATNTCVVAAFVSALVFGVMGAGIAGLGILALAAGATALVLIGLTNALAMWLSTPEDWQRP